MLHDKSTALNRDSKITDTCNEMLSLDGAIQFCAIGEKSGYLMALASNRRNSVKGRNYHQPVIGGDNSNSYEKEKAPNSDSLSHLNDTEMEKYSFHTGIIWGLHKSWENNLGRVRHYVAHYDDSSLVTVVLDDNHFLLLGMEPTSDPNIERILSQKVIPYLEKAAGSM
ncbi:MAG TPA: hypothetical protein VGA14_07370 [Nitrososphaera sp.]